MKTLSATAVVVGLLIVLGVVLALFIDTAPPQAVTHTNMHMMKRRILQYAAAHGALPTSLDQLPRIEGFSNGVTDGWSRPILWRVEADEVILTSYGRDGTPGGTGENADMVGVFRSKTADGRWADEFCEWRVDPYTPAK